MNIVWSMSLMLECCLVSAGADTVRTFLPPEVAASHTGCPARKTGALSVYPIDSSAAFSIASWERSPHSTWRTAPRATRLSVCHRHGYTELSALKFSRIKRYLVRRAQHGFQPHSETFFECFVLHGYIQYCAQIKKIVRLKNLYSQFHPLCPNSRRAFSERRSGASVVESRLEQPCEGMHASLGIEVCLHCSPFVIPPRSRW